MNRILQSVGPALIVAAVVIGPGSILTSSKVGATFGLVGLPVVIIAAVLMTAMVALAARIGVIYERSPCEEIAARLGRPVAVLIGLTLFTLVALFQSSNNIALIGGIEPLLGDQQLSFGWKVGILLCFNVLIVVSLYTLRDLYSSIENVMKLLIGLMTIAFIVNLVMVFIKPRSFVPVAPTESPELLPLLGMIGTTFSVGGAFYQAYLVKEKGWGIKDAKNGIVDAIFSISILGLITSVILLTAWRVFYGNPNPVTLSSVGDVAVQLEPTFGIAATYIFCGGILAGALSSFLVNALIGGTVMSDSIGMGAKLSDRGPLHLTVLALVVGGCVAGASLARSDSTVHLITLAQALTVLGIPALALALIYLGTRPELTGDRRVPRVIIVLAVVGLCVACVLACLTAVKVKGKLFPTTVQAAPSHVEDAADDSQLASVIA